MRELTAVLSVIGLVALPTMTSAQDLPSAGAARGGGGDNSAVYKEETVYDFEGDDVTGNLVKPDESNIQGEQHGKTSSLIDIRSDFIPEMLKSVEDL